MRLSLVLLLDFYEMGLNNDMLAMIDSSSEEVEVFVKTPWGSLCDMFIAKDVEMQGSVMAPLRCSVQVDSLGKDILSDHARVSLQVS